MRTQFHLRIYDYHPQVHDIYRTIAKANGGSINIDLQFIKTSLQLGADYDRIEIVDAEDQTIIVKIDQKLILAIQQVELEDLHPIAEPTTPPTLVKLDEIKPGEFFEWEDYTYIKCIWVQSDMQEYSICISVGLGDKHFLLRTTLVTPIKLL